MRPAHIRIGYIRVSTASGEQLSALENQRSRIEAAGVDRVVEDVESGMSQTREGFNELLRLIDRKAINELIVTRLDRLGRKADAVDGFLALAAKRGVTVIALDGGTVDSDTPQGFLLSRIATSLAEVEARMLSLRIRRGLEEGRKKKRPLRGKVPWGYQNNADKSALEPHPTEWTKAVEFLEILTSLDWRMATALDKWDQLEKGSIGLHSCRAVKAWLINPILRGGIGYNQLPNHKFESIVWDTHPALISRELYAHVEVQLENNRRHWGVNCTVKPRLLTSLCVCAYCKKSMPYAGGRTIPAVVCKTRLCPQRYKSTHESMVQEAIHKALSQRALDIASHVAVEDPEVAELAAQIARLEAMGDPDLADAISSKKQRMQNLHKEVPVNQELMQAMRDPAFWTSYSDDELRGLYQSLVQAVEIRDQQVERVVPRI